MAKMGRPRTFDRGLAIDQAMHLFWQHGYDCTSLNQLKAHIGGGITAPSFYSAFGSKEGLFKEVVIRYMATHGRVTESLFDTALSPRAAIELTLRHSAAMQWNTDHPKGCMVALGTMSGCSPDTAAIAQPLNEARALTRAGILGCIERGITQGELAGDTDAETLATMFESFLLGLSPLARDDVPLARIDAAITRIMSVWDAARFSPPN